MQIDNQLTNEINEYNDRFLDLKKILDLEVVKKKHADLKKLSHSTEFWQKSQAKQAIILKQCVEFEMILNSYEQIRILADEIKSAMNLKQEITKTNWDETEFDKELISNLHEYKTLISNLEIAHLVDKEEDDMPAILSLNSGAGGIEAMDWVLMLTRMYKRWTEHKNYEYSILDFLSGEGTGYKSALIRIQGYKAYGFLKSEQGVHRLVRISPFDSSKRRHTSFASVFITPEVDGEIKIDLPDGDLKIETLRSSGAGGQHVNTTDSAVRITHLPSGLTVKVQNERSQHKNKALALKILRSKLYQKELDLQKQKISSQHKSKIDFGQQIRSYTLYPYQLVKDHRSLYESSQAMSILDGDIDSFIKEYLIWQKKQNLV